MNKRNNQMQSRKTFIRHVALTGMALLVEQMNIFGKEHGFSIAENNSDHVIFYRRDSTTAYETLRKGFNKRINKYPDVIALCRDTTGVVEAMQYAKANNLKVTVKSGGHCMEGFSALDGGMVINLSLLNEIKWVDGNTISVGPACTLKKIYEAVIPKGKYLPGGSCQSVGIGGLTLGGGYGLLSRQFGLTCDSLLRATMVAGDGRILDTVSDPELLWALKGGGNGNFGVVTSMTFRLQKAPGTMQSFKFRNRNATIPVAKNICKSWFELVKTLPTGCFSAFIFNGRTTYILLTSIDRDLKPIKPVIDKLRQLSTSVSQGRQLPLGTALRAYYAQANPLTFKNASAGLYTDFAEIESVIDNVFTLIRNKPGMLYQVNTLGGHIQQASLEQQSSFPHRDKLYFSELQAYWESAAATNGFLKQFEAIQQQFTNAGIKAQYRNYPDINFRDWAQLYYGKSLPRLQAVKNKYDPARVFGGPQTL